MINELEDQIGDYRMQIDDLRKMMQETEVEVSRCLLTNEITGIIFFFRRQQMV